MRRVMLSHPLPVFGLVSLYLTNNLIGRSPLPRRQSFPPKSTWSITASFPTLSSTLGYVRSHYSPFRHCPPPKRVLVRLACFSHAASVQSEPGSNSSIDCLSIRKKISRSISKIRFCYLTTLYRGWSTCQRSLVDTPGWLPPRISSPCRSGRGRMNTQQGTSAAVKQPTWLVQKC